MSGHMFQGRPEQLTDGYHTMEELYDHRCALTAALAKALRGWAWRSKAHHPEDLPMFEGGYFIVGIDLPGAGTITYHYKLRHWEKFSGVQELAHAPKWDGAQPAATVDRLLEWAAQVRS
jgi:hypothetical protein